MKKKKQNNTKLILYILFTLSLIGSLAAESFIKVHGLFGLDGRLFFHAWYGLVSCVGIVVVSKFLGIFLKRKVNYYKEGAE